MVLFFNFYKTLTFEKKKLTSNLYTMGVKKKERLKMNENEKNM